VALAGVLALVALTAWLLAWPFEKAVYLAPVIVIGGLAAVGLVLLWGKIAVASLKESRRPRLVLAFWLASPWKFDVHPVTAAGFRDIAVPSTLTS